MLESACTSHIIACLISHFHNLTISYSHILNPNIWGRDFYPHNQLVLKSCLSSLCHTYFTLLYFNSLYFTYSLTIVTYLWDFYHILVCTHNCSCGANSSYVELSEPIRSYLEPSGATWSYLAFPGAAWSYLAFPGAIWTYLELSVAICSYL